MNFTHDQREDRPPFGKSSKWRHQTQLNLRTLSLKQDHTTDGWNMFTVVGFFSKTALDRSTQCQSALNGSVKMKLIGQDIPGVGD